MLLAYVKTDVTKLCNSLAHFCHLWVAISHLFDKKWVCSSNQWGVQSILFARSKSLWSKPNLIYTYLHVQHPHPAMKKPSIEPTRLTYACGAACEQNWEQLRRVWLDNHPLHVTWLMCSNALSCAKWWHGSCGSWSLLVISKAATIASAH